MNLVEWSIKNNNEHLLKEWHTKKNGGLNPVDVQTGSGKRVWWKCNKGHEWDAVVFSRVNNKGCPYCSGRYAVKGETDLATKNPLLAKEWHPAKNDTLTPEHITPGSNKKVWWRCEKGHEWDAEVVSRNSGHGCPYCSGRYAVKGETDLATKNPLLAKEWHPTKNGTLRPENVTLNSMQKVWWQCSNGHEWQSTVDNRSKGNRCPKCNGSKKTSFPEQMIYYYVKQLGNVEDIQNRTRFLGKEIDIYIPFWKIGIEYDGQYFHDSLESEKREVKKNKHFQNNGIVIIRIKESDKDYVDYDKKIIYCIYNNGYRYMINVLKNLSVIISDIVGHRINFDIDIDRDTVKIIEQYSDVEKENSLEVRNPKVASTWNYHMNGKLTPARVSYSSGKTVWWKCSKGHEWNSSIDCRNRGGGCPFCSNKKILKGYNDLATTNPMLAKEWHPAKNGILMPENVIAGSTKKVWWQCNQGHEWNAVVCSRNLNRGCPFCSNKKILKGYNDLATKNPLLAKEWHPAKNDTFTPENVTAGSTKKVWWQCNQGHEWESKISNRSTRGCPFCSNKKILKGYNDLATTNPMLVNEWHPAKNGILKSENVVSGSGKKVWWQCSKGHEWEAAIKDRNRGRGCSTCMIIGKVKK